MNTKIIGISISLIFILSATGGCFFFPRTSFVLISAEVGDDGGFPSLILKFNTSDEVSIVFSDPHNIARSSDTYYHGISIASFHFNGYRRDPSPGNYTITVYDKKNTSIFTKGFMFEGGNLTISSADETWSDVKGWGTSLSLVGLNMTVANHGDLPVYPDSVDVILAGKHTSVFVLPTVVLPGESRAICCFTYLDNITLEPQPLLLLLKNTDEQILVNISLSVVPLENNDPLQYSWDYEGKRHLVLPNPDCLATYYKSLHRLILEDYAAYVFNRYDKYYIDIVAERLLACFDSYFNEVDRVNAIASFVQTLPYSEDDPQNASFEYPRYPVEMLVDKQGDCEDKAILLASLLDSIGYNVSLIRLPNHMAVGIHLEKNASIFPYYVQEYFYLESTRFHWSVGEVPSEYKGISNVSVYPISSRPLLLHSWKNATRFTGSDKIDFVKMVIILENLGRGSARNIEVRAGFLSEDGLVYNQESVVVPLLVSGDKTQVSMKIFVPQGVSTFLNTWVYLDGKKVDTKESSSLFT